MNPLLDVLLGASTGIAVAALVIAMARRRDSTDTREARSPVTSAAASRPAVAPATNDLVVLASDRLPKFDDFGGLDDVKRDLQDTLGLVLRDPERAHAYRVTWN